MGYLKFLLYNWKIACNVGIFLGRVKAAYLSFVILWKGGKAKGRVQVPTLGHGIGVIAGYPFSHPISLTWFNIKMAVMQAIVHLKKRRSNKLYSCQQLMIHNTIPNTWLFSHFVPFISKKDQLLLGKFSVKS